MVRTCSVEGCQREHSGRGLCKTHYDQARKEGRLLSFAKTSPAGRPHGGSKMTSGDIDWDSEPEVSREELAVLARKRMKQILSDPSVPQQVFTAVVRLCGAQDYGKGGDGQDADILDLMNRVTGSE